MAGDTATQFQQSLAAPLMVTTRNQLCSCGSGLKYKRCCGKLKRQAGPPPIPALAPIRIVDDIAVVVPDTLRLMSPYVLREQENWFEIEVGFVRRITRPGMSVLDIGANYGVYTLLLAPLLGTLE